MRGSEGEGRRCEVRGGGWGGMGWDGMGRQRVGWDGTDKGEGQLG